MRHETPPPNKQFAAKSKSLNSNGNLINRFQAFFFLIQATKKGLKRNTSISLSTPLCIWTPTLTLVLSSNQSLHSHIPLVKGALYPTWLLPGTQRSWDHLYSDFRVSRSPAWLLTRWKGHQQGSGVQNTVTIQTEVPS